MEYRGKAVAHPMQALVKYHGLKDWHLRIPYHDSISVNMEGLFTETEIEFSPRFRADTFAVNGKLVEGRDLERVLAVVNVVRELAETDLRFKGTSSNSLKNAKGLGFSSSAGAALALSSGRALDLGEKLGPGKMDSKFLSRLARRFAGSACRSVVGEYARWYGGTDDETSFAVRIGSKSDVDLSTIIVPVMSDVKTEEAHKEVENSPFFKARNESAQKRCDEMERAIHNGELERTCELSEADTLELHSTTMTGRKGLLVYEPESLQLIHLVKKMRDEQKIPVYYSMQTGPSVFVNTYPANSRAVMREIKKAGFRCLTSSVGGEARLIEDSEIS
jgi:diphosphomevalonate decarboxylase